MIQTLWYVTIQRPLGSCLAVGIRKLMRAWTLPERQVAFWADFLEREMLKERWSLSSPRDVQGSPSAP